VKEILVDELSRDLLVAVLAVLTDAVPRPGLAAALKSWSQKRDQPLAQLLKAATGLDDERFRALECLAAAHLKTHQDDLRLSLQALNAQELAQCALTEIDNDDLRTTLATTAGCEETMPVDPASAGSKSLEFSLEHWPGVKDERFQLIRPHAQGGIGQVWLARDAELQREVAVKEIQPKYAEREDQRARFVLEAEITGSLEHPGIVPVYSLGRNADGRPYYAMRFIRGESLSAEIQRFHKKFADEANAADSKDAAKKDGAPDTRTKVAAAKRAAGSKWGIEFRQLIGRFLDVCDAIDYAHSRLVIHRDLKPLNIMLGPYGETLVVDWGLAKKIGSPEAPREPTPGDFEPPSEEATATVPEGTQQGTTIGTPAYMSPEQAKGLIDQIGPASDVYSLGASLYELITGKPPFHERRMSEVIPKVIAGEFPTPRAVDRSIPAPLEAICLKAMAREPQARYGSVRLLAQDLEHWLADEPTAAYAESGVEKLTRWFRQHRAWTVAAAAALIGISLVASIAAAVIEGSRHQEQIAREEAEKNFDMAQSAVEKYLTNVSENTLLKEQDALDNRGLRQELLRTALSYYEQFASERKDDPRLRQQLAKAYFRVGQITREISSTVQAMGAFRSALAIWEPLVNSNPKDRELSANLAECYLAMGTLESSNENYPEALLTLGRSRAILEHLWQDNPAEPRYQASLADCYKEMGTAHAKLNEPDESLALHEKARAIQQGLIDRYPENLGYKEGLARNLIAIGFAYFKRAKPDDSAAAIKTFQEVQDRCQALLKEVTHGPKPTWLLNLLALSQYNIGTIHKQSGALEKALPFLEQSLKYRSDLAEQHATVTRFREKLGDSFREIAELQHRAHQEEKALASAKRSVDVYKELVHAQPETASFHSDLALSLNTLGFLLDEGRNNDDAIRAFKGAIEEQNTAISNSHFAPEYQVYLCIHLDNLGEQYVDQGNPTEGLPHYQRAIQVRRELIKDHPENPEYTLGLVKALIALGNIERHLGEFDAAARTFTEARTTVEQALAAAAGNATLEARLAVVLEREAAVLADLAQPGNARPLLKDAADRFRPLAGRTAGEEELALERQWRSETLWELGRVLRDLDLRAEAAPADAERIDMWKAQPPEELVDLALLHLNQATLIGYGKAPVSAFSSGTSAARAEAVRELDLDQAASEVKLAVDRGLKLKDLGKLKSHPESDLLFSRALVKSALAGVQTSPMPTNGQPMPQPGSP
jgi:serine/threonine-protein kinase